LEKEGIIGVVDGDSRSCETTDKISTLTDGGASGIILYSASGQPPDVPGQPQNATSTYSIPILAAGPNRYQQLKGHMPIDSAVPYLPGKNLMDPSVFIVLGAAITAFVLGGIMGGEKSLEMLRRLGNS
jgi:hypothetical protein